MAGEIIPGFEIFADHLNMVKKDAVIGALVDIKELIVAEERPEEDATAPEKKATGNQSKE